MIDILNAMDELGQARDLMCLLRMTTDHATDDDDQARAAGCNAALSRLDAAMDLLRKAKGEAA